MTSIQLFKGWAFPLVVAHYRVYGDPDSWNNYGEKHVVIDTGEVMPEYDDLPIDIGFKGPFFEIVKSPASPP